MNSSAFSFAAPVDSIHKALTLLGLEKIRTWGSMLALSGMSCKPKILSSNALIRGRLCKMLTELLFVDGLRSDSMFTVGLLSSMDLFFDLPLIEVVGTLELSSWLKEALLERKGNMGLILNTAIFLEKAELDAVDWQGLYTLGIRESDIQSAYHDSIMWTADIMAQFR